jgi:hypothetical protein
VAVTSTNVSGEPARLWLVGLEDKQRWRANRREGGGHAARTHREQPRPRHGPVGDRVIRVKRVDGGVRQHGRRRELHHKVR